MTDVGDTTRDHIALGTPHPAETGLPTHEHETRLLRRSHQALLLGAAILALAYGGTFITSILISHGHIPAYDNPTARLFATLSLSTLQAGGASLILIYGLERITRPMRTLVRQAAVRSQETATAVTDLADTIERLRVINHAGIYEVNRARKDIAGLATRLDDVNARLVILEDAVGKIPDFAEGFSRGAYVTATALGLEKE
jgi:hypothetical protein